MHHSLLLLLLPQATFVDATDQAGLTMDHQPAALHPMVMMCGGGTVGDFNGDQWPDLFVPSGGTSADKLFINQQDGTFVEQALAWDLTALHYGSGSAAGDFNGDGFMDLYVCSLGPAGTPAAGHNKLYRNNGDGSFSDVAVAAGVNMPSVNYDNFGAAWGDYDGDGALDLMVTAYAFGQGGNVLYHNNGDGTFSDVTAAVGMTDLDLVRGLVADFVDIDLDGNTDIFVIADTGTSVFYRNLGNGQFQKETSSFPSLNSVNGMGIAVADFDQDLRLDTYVSDIYYIASGSGGNRLFLQQSPGTWIENSRVSGVYDDGWGWGIAPVDIDNDGLLDITGTNGWAGAWDFYPSRVFHNQGGGSFTEVAVQCGLVHSEQGRSMLRLDADRDGREDLVITAANGPLRYFHNGTVNANHWLQVAFDCSAHPGLAAHGIGTTVYATSGGYTMMRHLDSGQSYLGQGELTLQFGLRNWDRVEELRVLWADGSESLFMDVAADQRLVLRPSQPRISLSGLVAGASADFILEGAAAGTELMIAVGTAGPGPTQTPLGEIQVGYPFVVHTLRADGDGRAVFSAHVGARAQGVTLWAQAYDPAGGFLSNALSATVQ